MEFDVDLMIPDKSRSINEGAIVVMGWQSCNEPGSFTNAILQALAKEYPQKRAKYLLQFTLYNIAFLAAMIALYYILTLI